MSGYGTNKGKIWISRGLKSTMIDPALFPQFEAEGWERGNKNNNQKSQHKKWYNNGDQNLIVKEGDKIPNGYMPGMLKHPGTFAKCNYHWYTNGIDEIRVRDGECIPDGWVSGQSAYHKSKNSQGNKNALKLQNKQYSAVYKELYYDRELSEAYLLEHPSSIAELAIAFNCSVNSIRPWLQKFQLYEFLIPPKTQSQPEEKIFEYLVNTYPDIEFIRHDRNILEGKEIDIYVPSLNIGVEYNGTYWHSSMTGMPKHYHEQKSKLCQQKHIRLIHIYGYEWENTEQQEKIKSLLQIALKKVPSKIYARNCNIKQITNEEARAFNDKNHLQNHRNAQITYGLYYNDTLVQLMSFSKNKKYEWEIIRGCPGSNNIVVGGVSKLFSHFVKDYQPEQVFSYCDFNKFDGSGYESLGMKFIGYTGPDKKYIFGDAVISRNPSKYKEYKKNADGEIWGAGSLKFLWSKDSMMV